MNSALKNVTMFLYNHELISSATVIRTFKRFDLWSA